MEDLGFNEREINLSRLVGVIDEELQNIHNDREFTPLLRVSLRLPFSCKKNSLIRRKRKISIKNLFFFIRYLTGFADTSQA